MRASAVNKIGVETGAAHDQVPKLRVLYAEDQHSSRIVTTAMLQRLGYEVDAVEDGELALQKARNEHYDVILLDIEMPVMDGVVAARSIRAHTSACSGVPILALSAFLADSTEVTTWRDAFDFALPKPATSDELKRALARALKLTEKRASGQVGPTPTEILDGLKATLPKGSWLRLLATAADEMNHLALALLACREAADQPGAYKCAAELSALATNFNAPAVVAIAKCTGEMSAVQLLQAIRDWRVNPA
jgi:CheY-like chemotaxis protein